MGISYDVYKISENFNIKPSALYQLSNNQSKNYSVRIVKKRNGDDRRIYIPNSFLKYVQRQILTKYLYYLPVSDYCYAYVRGKSIVDNAACHVGNKMLLKLDIKSFFDSIDTDMVFSVFKKLGLDSAATGVFTGICTLKDRLPQGAPTSPYIANLVMEHFDMMLGLWCDKNNINYSRYCDDMAFSGDFDNRIVMNKVRHLLYISGFELNRDKIVFANKSQRQQVTGINVNAKLQISKSKRRSIRKEVYYCCKYGVDEYHLERMCEQSKEEYIRSLLGKIAYALQVNPSDREMQEYFQKIKKILKAVSQ